MLFYEHQIIYRDPSSIKMACFIFKPRPYVIKFNYEFGGCSFKLELTPKNKAMEEHFVGGVSWDKTGIIEEVLYLRSVKARDNRLTVPTRSEVIRRYEELDKVYEDIRLNGYDEKKRFANKRRYWI